MDRNVGRPAETVSTSRRNFVTGLAASSVLAALPGPAPRAQERAATRFARMFPQLPPFASPSGRLTAALLDIGKPGGMMDAHDNLAAGPVALIADPALSVNNPNAALPDGAAGTT